MSERVGNPSTGYDYECQYEHGDINCSDYIVCGGKIDLRKSKQVTTKRSAANRKRNFKEAAGRMFKE